MFSGTDPNRASHAPVGYRLSNLLALASYSAFSVVLFGRGVVGSLNANVVGDRGSDKTIPIWA